MSNASFEYAILNSYCKTRCAVWNSTRRTDRRIRSRSPGVAQFSLLPFRGQRVKKGGPRILVFYTGID